VDFPISTEFDRPFTPESVLDAYRRGIFPMGDEESDLIYWYRPDPRAIIPLDALHVSRSLRRTLRRGVFEVSYDRAFTEVMIGCAEGRPVWITERVHELYNVLHERGAAHSVEVWRDGELAGGLYGVQLGAAFMAESMFHRVGNASKVALVKLVERLRERGFEVLEVQYLTDHLQRVGGREISLRSYLSKLRHAVEKDCRFAP
jgi:leucyl/phenylalanyl-tRNA--protein transferase